MHGLHNYPKLPERGGGCGIRHIGTPPLKLVMVRYFFNEKKGIFYYTADGRIDFRQLVKDLAKEFKMRIEMRQVGVRDEAVFRVGEGGG
jgi:cell fate regulator YaaT (PSP1 superfamily)